MANDNFEIMQEWLQFWRNSDIFSISTRGVTTDTETGTFASDSSQLINRTNIKNIRSVVVASVTLTYGEEYTVDFTFDDSGTIKTKISFVSAQTGDFTITYDYGTDKIFPDWPRNDLSISAFPRITCGVGEESNEPLGFGGTNLTAETATIPLTLTIHSSKIRQVEELMADAKPLLKASAKDFFFFGFTRRTGSSILIEPSPEEKTKIFHKTLNFESINNVEK